MNIWKLQPKLIMGIDNDLLKCGLINIQSVRNKTHSIHELITDELFDVLCITETWLRDFDLSVISEMTPSTHTFIHLPREGRVGGGVGVFLSNRFSHIRMIDRPRFGSFEFIEVSFKFQGCNLLFIVVYRAPNLSASEFFDQFDDLLERIDTITAKVIICGDFNFWMDVESDVNRVKFVDLLESHQLSNYVDKVTSTTGHMLDLVLGITDDNFIKDVKIDPDCRFTSIHKLITFRVPLVKDKWVKRISFRNKNDFSPDTFINDVMKRYDELVLTKCDHDNSVRKLDCVDCLVGIYNKVNENEYNGMCPEIEKNVVVVNSSPWYNSETLQKKREKRRYEKKWRKLKTNESWLEYSVVRNQYNELLRRTKTHYYKKKLSEAGYDMRRVYCILNSLTGNLRKKNIPDGFSDQELANNFLDYFKNKIDNIIHSFVNTSVPAYRSCMINTSDIRFTCFHTVDLKEISDIMAKSRKTNCIQDPMPIADIAAANNFNCLENVILKIVNRSILMCKFPVTEKIAAVLHVLKGLLNPQSLSSYRQMSNLSYLSKIIENVILRQLNIHLARIKARVHFQLSRFKKKLAKKKLINIGPSDFQVLLSL